MQNENQASTIDKELKQWAEYLLINELCNITENEEQRSAHDETNDMFKTHSNKNLNCSFLISNFINPFYVPLQGSTQKQSSNNTQDTLMSCMQLSLNTNPNLSLLLNSVQQIPKLRYQQSSQTLQPNSNNSSQSSQKFVQQGTHQGQTTPQTHQKQLNSKRPNIFHNSKQSSTSDTNPKFQFQHSANHKVLYLEEISNQESQIQSSMSARSNNQIHLTRQDAQGESRGYSSQLVNKNRHLKKELIYQTPTHSQSEHKSKQQRSMIQNYFESAKNRVFQNCSMNCCEGMFDKTQETNVNYQKHNLNIKYGKQSAQKAFKKK